MSTLRCTNLQDTSGGNSLTTAQIYNGAAKAWVNFNGTFATSPFTTANGGIRAAFNVSSITDNGTGDYTVNFSTAFSDTNFITIGTASNTAAAYGAYLVDYTPTYARTTSSVRIWTGSSSSLQDSATNNVAVFR